MATITPRKNKNGEIISYQIEVYRGRDINGKKLKPFSMNWKVPNGWKNSSIQKELTKIAGEFETNCKQGNISIDNQTFEAYAMYVMQIKRRDCKHRTVKRYEELLERINEEIGFLKLTQITAEHLNRFYLKLSEKGQPMHPDTLNSWISRFEKRHNLPHIYPHKFRHTQASLLYSNGIDQVTISKRLGHKKVSTTQDIYAHLMANNDKKASDSIARILYNKEA